jgi:predicted permease
MISVLTLALAPTFFVMLLGYTAGRAGIVNNRPLPVVALAALREIGQAAGGLALFVTGLVLSERPFRLSRNTVFGAGIANIAQPLIAFAICRELGASVPTTKLSVVMAGST